MARDLEYGDLNQEQRDRISGVQEALGGNRGIGKRLIGAVGDAFRNATGGRFHFDQDRRIYSRRRPNGDFEFSLDGRRPATPEELEAQGTMLSREARQYINSVSGRRLVTPDPETQQSIESARSRRDAQPAAIPEDRRMVGPTGGEAADARQSEGARSPFVFDSQGNAMVTVEGVGQISQQDLSELSLTDLEKVAVAVGLPRSAHTNEIRDALRNARRE